MSTLHYIDDDGQLRFLPVIVTPGGAVLAALDNPAGAQQILRGFEAYSEAGETITGTAVPADEAMQAGYEDGYESGFAAGAASVPAPSGTMQIAENGTFDVSAFAFAEVDVPQTEQIGGYSVAVQISSGGATVITVTANGGEQA